jgi:hypothetical protein
VRGSVKYGSTGGCTAELLSELNLPAETAQSLASLGNLGVAKSTWSAYKTAKVMVDKCQSETKTDLTLPFDQKKTLIFIDWLVRIRKVSAATVNTYLSGVRQLHIVNNIDLPILRSNLTKLILKGISNRDGIKKRSERNPSRLPMTINTMLVFKNTIVSSHLNNNDKRLVWAVATLAFAGAFRLGELLSKHEATFDPDFTLLTKDIKLSTDHKGSTTVQITLKCPKEAKNATPTVVDVFQNDGPICPVKAFTTWFRLKPRKNNSPLFRFENGTPLTSTRMNKLMHLLLGPYTKAEIGSFCGHSFRIGLASLLASSGLTDEELQAAGRWSSRAFEVYMKLKRTKRSSVGRKIGQLTK